MNAQRIVSIALKLIGVYLLVNSLGHLTRLIQTPFLFTYDGFTGIYILFIPCFGAALIYVIACLTIILKSEALSKKIVQSDETFATPGINAETIQTVAFCVIGLISIINGFLDTAQYLTNYYIHKHHMYYGTGMTIPFRQYGNLVASVIQLIIGITLFLKAKGLVELWKRMQTTTRVKQP